MKLFGSNDWQVARTKGRQIALASGRAPTKGLKMKANGNFLRIFPTLILGKFVLTKGATLRGARFCLKELARLPKEILKNAVQIRDTKE